MILLHVLQGLLKSVGPHNRITSMGCPVRRLCYIKVDEVMSSSRQFQIRSWRGGPHSTGQFSGQPIHEQGFAAMHEEAWEDDSTSRTDNGAVTLEMAGMTQSPFLALKYINSWLFRLTCSSVNFFVNVIVTMQKWHLHCTSHNGYLVVPGMQFYQMSS